MSKVEGRVRESADGLRSRKSAKQTREAQKRVGEEAAARRQTKVDEDLAEEAIELFGGKEGHGHKH